MNEAAAVCVLLLTLHLADGAEGIFRVDDISVTIPAVGTTNKGGVHAQVLVHDNWFGVRESVADIRRMMQGSKP